MSEISRKELGRQIAKSRRKAGLTQKEVAKKLNVSQPYYSQIEKGFHEVHEDRLSSIATIFGTSSEQLLNGLEVVEEKNRPLKEILPGDPGSEKFFDKFRLVKEEDYSKSLKIIAELMTQLDYQFALLKSASERNRFLRQFVKDQLDQFSEMYNTEPFNKIFPEISEKEIFETVNMRKKLLGLDINDPLDDYIKQYDEFKQYISQKINLL